MNDHNTWEYAHCINSFLAVSNLEYDNGDNDVDSVLYVSPPPPPPSVFFSVSLGPCD